MKKITKIISTTIIAASILVFPMASSASATPDGQPTSFEADWCGAYSNVVLGGDPSLRPLNKAIYDKTQKVAVSPYDRFGNNISFTWYGGEKKMTIGLIDNLYADLLKKNKSSQIDMSTFLDISDSTLQDQVYPGRVPLITEQQYAVGGKDPRREAYTCVPGVSGGDVAVGNFYMGIANNIQTVVSWLLNSEQFVGWAANAVAGVVAPMSNVLWLVMVFALSGFVIWLVVTIARYTKGTISGRIAAQGIAATIIALGIFAMFVSNPKIVSSTLANGTEAIQTMAKATMNATSTPQFCKSGIADNVYSCNIFYSTIYEDWAAAEGLTNLQVSEATTKVVGVPQVPLGDNQFYTNDWGVFVYSAESKYHIQTLDTDTLSKGEWAATLPMSSNVYVDMVRANDARMGIANPANPDAANIVIPGHQMVTEDRTSKGLWMIFKALTLAPIAYVAVLKAWALFSILLLFVKMIVESIRTVFQPGSSRLTMPFRALGDNFKLYLFTTLQAYLLISLYTFMSNGALIFLWIVVGVAIALIKPKQLAEQGKKIAVIARQLRSKSLVRGKV